METDMRDRRRARRRRSPCALCARDPPGCRLPMRFVVKKGLVATNGNSSSNACIQRSNELDRPGIPDRRN